MGRSSQNFHTNSSVERNKSRPASAHKDPEHMLNSISAKSYCIYDINNKKFLMVKKETMKREVASLTKMMTFYTVLRCLNKYQLHARNTFITISKTASRCTGTTANLKEGDVLTVE